MKDPVLYAIPFFLLTMALEAFALRRRQTRYQRRDTLTSLSGGLGFLLVALLTKAATFALYERVYAHRLVDLGALPWYAWYPLLFLAEDLCYYAYHRTSHEVRLFWAGHVAHHSSLHYNLSTALRQSWTEPFFGWIFWLPLPLLGIRPELVFFQQAVSLVYQYWIHTETIDRLGPLEWIFNTPSHHRVHHGSDAAYLDKNHAGILIVWDRLFGTFEPERQKPTYGLTKNVGTFNPLVVQTHELVAIARDVGRAKSLRSALRAAFAGPGAKLDDEPAGSSATVADP
jgi:sterol desaturase/sphingolipid hydroxylase (fatty acid hydroxylase superfamily)